MDVFVTETLADAAGIPEIHDVSLDEFVNATGKEFPFMQDESMYAICPDCENPVQLTGLFGNGQRKPYGKHAGKDIPGLPEWNRERYLYCTYADPSVRIDPPEERAENFIEPDERVISLYELLRKEFDSVVFIIEKTIGIKCSAAFWEKCLDSYLDIGAYGYRWMSDSTLPYIFAYWGMHQKGIYGQFFKKDTELCRTLAGQPGVEMKECGNGYRQLVKDGTKFLDLSINFNRHKRVILEDGTAKEYMECCILSGADEKIYSWKIEFDLTFFHNMANRTGRYRRQELLDYADKRMKPLK